SAVFLHFDLPDVPARAGDRDVRSQRAAPVARTRPPHRSALHRMRRSLAHFIGSAGPDRARRYNEFFSTAQTGAETAARTVAAAADSCIDAARATAATTKHNRVRRYTSRNCAEGTCRRNITVLCLRRDRGRCSLVRPQGRLRWRGPLAQPPLKLQPRKPQSSDLHERLRSFWVLTA